MPDEEATTPNKPNGQRMPTEAEEDKSKAEAEQARANARKANAEADEAAAKAAVADITLKREQTKYKREQLADDFDHHRYLFDGAVTDTSIKSCIKQLNQWDRENSNCDIEVAFSSPGGFVMDGMELFDFITSLRHEGRKITTSAYGMAASMAGILLQAGDVRVCGPQAYILIHEVSGGTGGKTSEIEDEVAFMQKMQKRIIAIFADRCQSADASVATKKLTAGQIARRWKRRDWWIDADEALALGLVDDVR